MKKYTSFICLLSVFLVSAVPVFSQNREGYLVDYYPAPGQHINIASIGTPEAARVMTQNVSSLVSLGSFGGSIILKFETACINHPDNPYGIDFTIFGNAFAGSSEPGVVWVMNDENRNGLADDTWYEIAGSSHYFSGTIRNYAVTYFKTPQRDVLWKDNYGKTGHLFANEFNLQEYYPENEYFPSYPPDSVRFYGTLLENNFINTNSQEIKLAAPIFGYTDCHPRVADIDLSLPDNPYTLETEGAGGDPFDISWATDSLGNYVDLDSIHFIKIVSASLNDAGWLGEISTDVAWVQAVQHRPEIIGKENLLVVKPHKPKVLKGDSLKLEAVFFSKGRNIKSMVSVQSLNETVATIDSSGMLMALSEGETQVRFSANDEVQLSSVKVVSPESIKWLSDFSAVYPGDTLELKVQILDNEQEALDLLPVFSSSDPSAGKIIYNGNKAHFVANQPGEIVLVASVEGFQVKEQVTVKIHSQTDKIEVLVSVKTSNENLLPLQLLEVGRADLNAVVENRQKDYSNPEKISLFHALATGLQMANVTYKFRDDEAAGGKLYLYNVEYDGLFSYGWGGKTNSVSIARAWIARLNNTHYLNDFDNIILSDGDTLVLYHVPDLLNTWEYSRLLPVNNTTATTDFIEVLLEKTSCLLENGIILESGFMPVANTAVNSGITYYTNDQGKVQIESDGNFPLIVYSGNDAILIKEDWITDVSIPEYGFHIYPNPVNEFLFINAQSHEHFYSFKSRLRIVNLAGEVVLEKNDFRFPVNLNLGFLTPGMYHLVIEGNKQLEIHKIVKR